MTDNFFSQFVELVDCDQCNITFIGTTTDITIIIIYQSKPYTSTVVKNIMKFVVSLD